jgi:hypothetical protein
MLRVAFWVITSAALSVLVGCSGKTERAGSSPSGEATPAQQPAAGPANADAAQAEPARHLLMVIELEPASHVARTLTARSVELPLPRRRGPARAAPWRADVLARDGAVLFSVPLDDASTLRAEFPDAQGKLSGVTLQKQKAALSLRLPWLAGAAQVRVVKLSDGADVELGRVPYPEVQP